MASDRSRWSLANPDQFALVVPRTEFNKLHVWEIAAVDLDHLGLVGRSAVLAEGARAASAEPRVGEPFLVVLGVLKA